MIWDAASSLKDFQSQILNGFGQILAIFCKLEAISSCFKFEIWKISLEINSNHEKLYVLRKKRDNGINYDFLYHNLSKEKLWFWCGVIWQKI